MRAVAGSTRVRRRCFSESDAGTPPKVPPAPGGGNGAGLAAATRVVRACYNGLMIIYVVPVVMAGVFGHALAEHRDSEGAEKAAAAAAEKTLSAAKGKVAHVPESARTVVFTIVGTAFFLGCVAASMEWWGTCLDHSVCTAAEFGPGGSLFFTISMSLYFGILMMHPLAEAILGIDSAVFFCFWCLALIAVGGISSLLLGWVGWTVTLWTVLLGTTAFFGYCVRVYDSYVKIIRSHIPG